MSEHDTDAVERVLREVPWISMLECNEERLVRQVVEALRPGDRLPGGLVVVPAEPTKAMVDSIFGLRLGSSLWLEELPAIYRAMLAVSGEG